MLRATWQRFPCVVLVAALLLAACAAPPAPPPALDTTRSFGRTAIDELPATPSYRIGLNTEVTGNGAQIGDLSVRAARLAVEEINAAGGVNGVPLELVVRDCQSDVATALDQYRLALAEDRLVALIGPLKSAYAVRMVPEHRSATIPMLIGATNPSLTTQGDTRLFRMRPSDRLAAAAMVTLAVEQLQAGRIGLIHDSDAFGTGGAQQVNLNLARRRMAPVAQAAYTTGTRDFDLQVQAMAAANAEALLIYGTNSTDVGRLLRTIRYWGLRATIITSPGGGSVVTWNIAAEAQDGIYVTTDAVFGATPEGARFETAFQRRFELQPDTYIAWIYDSIYLLADALRGHGPDPATLSQALRDTTYTGAQGVYRFDEAGEGLHRVMLVRMQNGKPGIVGQYSHGRLEMTSSSGAGPAVRPVATCPTCRARPIGGRPS
jgi:branched-chain amino acid transport system substrate-binding protein